MNKYTKKMFKHIKIYTYKQYNHHNEKHNDIIYLASNEYNNIYGTEDDNIYNNIKLYLKYVPIVKYHNIMEDSFFYLYTKINNR